MRYDPAYSTENFRRIWDLRTRRGENLIHLFPELINISEEIKDQKRVARQAGRDHPRSKSEPLNENHAFSQKILELEKIKNARLANLLERTSMEVNQRIDSGNFTIGLRCGATVRDKQTYVIDSQDAASYFIARQVESNLKQAYNLTPPNRNLASEQLLRTLQDKTQKYIIRTDIKSFYESIPREPLLLLIRSNPHLGRTTYRFIESLLTEYSKLSGASDGIPRGLGVSSYLAEIYLSQLDTEILDINEVLLYTRYVDDIAIIMAGNQHQPELQEHRKTIRAIVNNLGLKLNPSKTKYIYTADIKQSSSFSYLGYEYILTDRTVNVEISKRRYSRYKHRLNLAFQQHAKSTRDGRQNRILVNRIKFLTGNTKLTNNKRQALIGVYFSNSLLNAPTVRIMSLDKHLQYLTRGAQLNPVTEAILDDLSFESGFSTKRYNKFTVKELERIVVIWKYAEEA